MYGTGARRTGEDTVAAMRCIVSEASAALALVAMLSKPEETQKLLDNIQETALDAEQKLRGAVERLAEADSKELELSRREADLSARQISFQETKTEVEEGLKAAGDLLQARVKEFEAERDAAVKQLFEQEQALSEKSNLLKEKAETLNRQEIAIQERESAILERERAADAIKEEYISALGKLRAAVGV